MIKTDFMSNVRNFKKELEKNKEKSDKIEKEKVDSKNKFQRLLEESKTPRPLGIDEVAASFISMYRVSSWENLGDNFGGYKVGRILAYILGVLNEKIEESTAATIRVDVPLYEQCPTILLKNKKEERFCAYCKETDGTINHDVFIEILDAELGKVWVCKECFLESAKESDEERARLQKENDKYFYALSNLKALVGRGEDIGFSKDKINKINDIIDNALTNKEEE